MATLVRCRRRRTTPASLVEVEIPAASSNDVYEQRIGQALAEAPLAAAHTIAFGDLFLSDIRAYREERLRRVGKEAIFPLWGKDTSVLAHEFIAAGFEPVLVCVDPRRLDPSFRRERFDTELPRGRTCGTRRSRCMGRHPAGDRRALGSCRAYCA